MQTNNKNKSVVKEKQTEDLYGSPHH